MTTIPRNQTHLAELLNVSKGSVSRMAARGMPTDSLEAAQAWRKSNLDPVRIKGSRFDQYRKPRPLLTARPAPENAPSDRLAHAVALMDMAEATLAGGACIDALIPTLREALHAVPEHERLLVTMPLEAMRILTAEARANQDPNYRRDPAMTDDEASYMYWLLYQVAAGEIYVDREGDDAVQVDQEGPIHADK